MKKIKWIVIILFGWTGSTYGQLYTDYIGAGHSDGITVTSSSEMVGSNGPAERTLDGSGMDNAYMEASRFLAQSTLGYRDSDIESVMDIGFEAWIDDQMNEPATLVLPELESIWQYIKDELGSAGEDTTNIFGPYSVHYNYAIWTVNMTNEDLLRQRVAQALSEILVISMNSDLNSWAEAMSSYYDILIENAFGNYEDIMNEVTKHPSMGYYLSHINNPKTDTLTNIRPDENYAREIMQLFSIGLYELNQDGTHKRDANGNSIPTYDNTDIKELAKVFTGMGAGAILDPTSWPFVPIFGVGMWAIDKTVPMQMFQTEHEDGPKVLLKDVTIDIPGNGMAEVDSAVSYLFHHDNVGPFLAYRLIQRMVKSNPSPDYISRVAAAFNDNGQGERGDMKAVVKAILLDEEARDGSYMGELSSGQFRAPFYRYLQFLRKQPVNNPAGLYWNNGFTLIDNVMHWPLAAPSVFNFYTPDFQPVGDISENDLYAPEFKIHNTSTAIKYINLVHAMILWDSPWYDWENDDVFDNNVTLNMTYLESISEDPEKMINELDKYLTHGQLSEETRGILRTALDEIYWPWNEEWKWWRARMLLYFYLISPDFAILK